MTETQKKRSKSVPAVLPLQADADLAEAVKEDHTAVGTVSSGLLHDPFATFDEWNNDADHKAYDVSGRQA